MVVFEERGNRSTRRKPLGAEKRTNKLSLVCSHPPYYSTKAFSNQELRSVYLLPLEQTASKCPRLGGPAFIYDSWATFTVNWYRNLENKAVKRLESPIAGTTQSNNWARFLPMMFWTIPIPPVFVHITNNLLRMLTNRQAAMGLSGELTIIDPAKRRITFPSPKTMKHIITSHIKKTLVVFD